MNSFSRRRLLRFLGVSGLLGILPTPLTFANTNLIKLKIPTSGELITAIGMGTWQTFNVGSDPVLRQERTKVLKAFFDNGGQLIDSSPMYGSSQAVLGFGLKQLQQPESLFSADKVWTRDGDATQAQIAQTASHWGIERFDLMQIHNLLSWQAHLETLKAMKADQRIRYIGITTSHGRRHDDLEAIMAKEPLDFIQLTYNLTHRDVEQRLLPLAQEKGIAVIANRPFDGGRLVKGLQRRNASLPPWSKEFDVENWPQFLLKFIISHPAITCAIPATTKVDHMQENMSAARGRLPNVKQRQQMIRYLETL